MCSTQFPFVLVAYGIMFVTLVVCLMVVLKIMSSFPWLDGLFRVFFFFAKAFVRDDVWHLYATAGKTHWLRIFVFRLTGRCLSRKIYLYVPETLHSAFILIGTSCFVLFSIANDCPRYLLLVTFSIFVPFICILSVVSIFVINLVCPLYILIPVCKLFLFIHSV